MIDVHGKAIHEFHFAKSKAKLYVHDSFGPKDEMPVSYYFRNFKKMPALEKKALELCTGKILDIGAAAGSHALELQKKHEVTALEISPNCIEVMKDRGVNNIIHQDFFALEHEAFDTLLLLMNGIGISGTIDGFKKFLQHANQLLKTNGKIIFDSCDVSYMFEDIEKPQYYYFGEVKCRYEYRKELTDWFSWLYLDKNSMQEIAGALGWSSEIVMEDEHQQYLAVLTKS